MMEQREPRLSLGWVYSYFYFYFFKVGLKTDLKTLLVAQI